MASNNLDNRLRQDRRIFTREKGSTSRHRPPSRYQKMADATGGELLSNESGSFCLIRTEYRTGCRFGSCAIPSGLSDMEIPRFAFTAEHKEGSVRLTDLLFFDIETTGLGGTGAVAFLVGFGSVTTHGFEVRQYLLPDYCDERAMLVHLMSELTAGKTLVSYNGTAFDVNLLRDRMIVNRVAREIETEAHFDLLHVTRRLFRRRLKDCSLVNVERELLGFLRKDDIPGYLVPSVYFEWLAEESLELLSSVLLHNRLDVVSLCFLLNHVASAFATEGGSLHEVDDIYSLSRVYGRRKMNEKVIRLLGGLQNGTGQPVKPEILLYQAQALKRAGEWLSAVSLWEWLCGEQTKEGYWANVELAKYFEHKARDPLRAYEHTHRAGRVCPDGESHRRDLQKRLSRLRSKLNR